MEVSKVQLANGEVLVDLTNDSVTPDTLAEGITAHDASGVQITGTKKSDGGASVQADWNQTDDTAADFIKNRTHYRKTNVILEEQELSFDAEQSGLVGMVSAPIQDGDIIEVVFDGERYECKAEYRANFGAVIFGNHLLLDGLIGTGEPFFGVYVDGMALFLPTDEASHIVKVSVFEFVKIPEKYLSQPKFYAKDVANNKGYLYTDVSCTVKATVSDIPDGADYTVGLVFGSVVGVWCKPIASNSKFLSETNGYASVLIMYGAQIIELTTSEYTPTT